MHSTGQASEKKWQSVAIQMSYMQQTANNLWNVCYNLLQSVFSVRRRCFTTWFLPVIPMTVCEFLLFCRRNEWPINTKNINLFQKVAEIRYDMHVIHKYIMLTNYWRHRGCSVVAATAVVAVMCEFIINGSHQINVLCTFKKFA